jgi:hypothetical protein
MGLITIVVEAETMEVVEGEKVLGSRLEWSCSDLQVYIKGELTGEKWEQATALALAVCYDRHIPAYSLKRVKRGGSSGKGRKTDTKFMFGGS